MASQFYTDFKRACLAGEINLSSDTVKVYAVDLADYTFSAAHSALADIPVAARVAEATLTSKTIAAGRFDSANPVLPSVTGDQFEALVLVDTTADTLIAYYDGYTETPNGNNINITVDALGWFDL